MEKVKEKKIMFVVTRRGRRVEPKDYAVESEAQDRAAKLVKMLKEYSPSCARKVGIVKTKNPNTVC